ncbi:unnamed protein product, partial [Ectocarpus sp. 12 AP-2014]
MGFSDDESSGLGRASDEVCSSGSTRDGDPTSDAVEQFANIQDSKEEVPAPPVNTQDLATSKPKSRHRDNLEWLASLGEKISETPTTPTPLGPAPATAEDPAAASKD